MKQPSSVQASRIRRHLRWAVPLIVGVAAYFGFGLAGGHLLDASSGDDAAVGEALGGMGLLLLAGLVPLIALVFFIVGVVRALSEWHRTRRHAAGRHTRAELAEQAREQHLARSWERARTLSGMLAQREVPPQIHVWDVVPNAGEVFFFDGGSSYARFYGQDVAFNQSSGFFFGHPLFVAAGVALTAASNSARRSSAEAAAQTQWREHQAVRLLVSNQRLVCNVNGNWLSFSYSAMTAVYPEVDRWTLVCQLDSTSPLLLHGADVPSATLVTILMTYGPEAIQHHPSLTSLSQ